MKKKKKRTNILKESRRDGISFKNMLDTVGVVEAGKRSSFGGDGVVLVVVGWLW